jgi:hypothetical protein
MVDDGDTLFVRFNWDHTALPMVPSPWQVTFKDIHISPEPEYPCGRKGLMLARYWEQQKEGIDRIGIMILDGDVLADPEDIRALAESVASEPDAVHTAPVRLWYSGQWFWSHQGEDMKLTRECLMNPYYFSFCLTFIPTEVMNAAIKAGLDTWYYPYVDKNMSEIAAKIGAPVRVALKSYPKHMHW